MKPPPWQYNEAYRQAFTDLVQKHGEMMYQTALRITGNQHDAQDAVETALLQLNQGPPPGDFIKNPEAYLRRMTRNRAVDLVRSRDAQKLTDEDVGDLQIAAPELSPDRLQKVMNVRATLKALKPGYAEILELAYVDELSCREISAQLGRGLQA